MSHTQRVARRCGYIVVLVMAPMLWSAHSGRCDLLASGSRMHAGHPPALIMYKLALAALAAGALVVRICDPLLNGLSDPCSLCQDSLAALLLLSRSAPSRDWFVFTRASIRTCVRVMCATAGLMVHVLRKWPSGVHLLVSIRRITCCWHCRTPSLSASRTTALLSRAAAFSSSLGTTGRSPSTLFFTTHACSACLSLAMRMDPACMHRLNNDARRRCNAQIHWHMSASATCSAHS